MPKKKVAKPIKKSVPKRAATKSSSDSKKRVTKTSAKKAGTVAKKVTSKNVAVTKLPSKRTLPKPSVPEAISTGSAASTADVSLGQPLVTQEEKLYMLFHDDYQARQVFEFLRVDIIKELEQFSPQQIVHMMSKPLRMTVDRIRERLAKYKRSLKDDEQFAADYLKKME